MQITELKVTIGEVCEGYINDAEEGVVGYDERLDIRPKYQREFVYKDKQPGRGNPYCDEGVASKCNLLV